MARKGVCREDLDILLLFQAILYSALLVLLLVATISVATLSAHFNGECILFCTVEWQTPNQTSSSVPPSQSVIHSLESSATPCQFVVYASSAAILYLLVVAIHHFYALNRSLNNPNQADSFEARPIIFLNCIFAIFSLIHASLASAGYYGFCSSQISGGFVDSCSQLEDDKLWQVAGKAVNPANALTDVKMAAVCLWLACVTWVAVLALSIIEHMKHQRSYSSRRYGAHLVENSGIEMITPTADDKEETVLFTARRPSSA